MKIFELLVLAVGLSVDAFSVSVCKGLSQKPTIKHAVTAGLYFGIFQALMPLIGYFIMSKFAGIIEKADHWIIFILLAAIGIKMIIESFKDEELVPGYDFKSMIPLAFATSVDAMAAGASLVFLKIPVLISVTVIGVTTFLFSFAGVELGGKLGGKFQKRAVLFGGAVLILLGLKILLEHMGVISF